MFEIPVVLFTFKRKDTVFRIIDRLAIVKPSKLYIISDGPRNDEEREAVLDVRKSIEDYISWDCEVIKNYAEENKGVYNRIGEGAKWVFSKEERAIFLEDDNLPEVTFFQFCQEMLDYHKENSQVLWICGTNYLKENFPVDNSSYMFTKHLLPCGWASWDFKFLKYYDGELDLLDENSIKEKVSKEYWNKALFKQEFLLVKKTKYLLENDKRNASWDRQMSFSIRAQGLYGVSPARNQIENIGVDIHSIHGGTSFDNVMTRRFCGIKTIPLDFPLIHPKVILRDNEYETKIGKIILYPLLTRIKISIMSVLKPLLGIDKHASFKMYLKEKFNKS